MGRRGGKFSSSGPAQLSDVGESSQPQPPKNSDPIVSAAKLLSKLYFETVDNQREKTVHLYANDCALYWNGNRYVGGQDINQFWTTIHPLTSLHTVSSHTYNHAAPLNILIIMHSGTVTVEGKDHIFTQTLTCCRENDQWKILTDDYRYMS